MPEDPTFEMLRSLFSEGLTMDEQSRLKAMLANELEAIHPTVKPKPLPLPLAQPIVSAKKQILPAKKKA